MGFSIDEKGWLTGVKHSPSPNFNQRPDNMAIDVLVIHNISLPPGEFEGNDVEAFFTNSLEVNKHPYYQAVIKDMKVSAHLFIRRTGEVIQFVSFLDRAWHAGKSNFKGREACNDFSIGIELEGTDELPYTEAQYGALKDVTQALMQRYPIHKENITGHCHIAPDRKTDPGQSFDWQRFLGALE
jgi:AmpD protein